LTIATPNATPPWQSLANSVRSPEMKKPRLGSSGGKTASMPLIVPEICASAAAELHE
jgi:hypothetical protein